MSPLCSSLFPIKIVEWWITMLKELVYFVSNTCIAVGKVSSKDIDMVGMPKILPTHDLNVERVRAHVQFFDTLALSIYE